MINPIEKEKEQENKPTMSWNELLDRTKEVEQIKSILQNLNMSDINSKRGIYLYGNSGIGKTTFMENILTEMNYHIIRYEVSDIKNKTMLDEIVHNHISNNSILSMFHKKPKKNILFIDEIDAMISSDKSGLNTLIKLIRPKKTKKQKTEKISFLPIVFIGNYYVDKKIKELIKVCHTIELKTPTNDQIQTILERSLPPSLHFHQVTFVHELVSFVQNDFRKIVILVDILKHCSIENSKDISTILKNIFCLKSYNENAKETVRNLMIQPFPIKEHNVILNETDRTIIGLLWHENIVNGLEKEKTEISIPFYLKQLENMCFSDYIDKITFQHQIWQFNEMSSLMKTFYNHKLYHDDSNISKELYKMNNKENEIRFTKVLTKYSTEYNNFLFLQYLCQQLMMDKKDVISFFTELREKYEDYNEVLPLLENYEISKLNIQRMYRFLDNNIKDDKVVDLGEDVEGEEDIDE